MRRKLTILVLSMEAGVVLMYMNGRLASFCLLLLAAGCMAGSGRFRRDFRIPQGMMMGVCLAFLAGALLLYGQRNSFLTGRTLDSPSGRMYTGTVLGTEAGRNGSFRLLVRIEQWDLGTMDRPDGVHPVHRTGLYPADRAVLTCRDPGSREWTGRRIRFWTVLEEPETSGNPRCFDYRNYLRTRGISHTGRVRSFRQVKNQQQRILPGIWFRAERHILVFRERFLLSLKCPEEVRQLIRGALFGDTKGMDEDLMQDFRNNGTAHVLAVSGLHIGILYDVYRRLWKRGRKRGLTAVFIMILLLYGTLTLWAVSVTRAVLLVFLVMLGDRMERRYDLLTALSLVSAVLVIRCPWVLLGTSFQMSFLAVLSICMYAPVLERRLPRSVGAALAVQIGMIPYTAYTFNVIPVAGILWNIPVIWLLGVLVPAGLSALAVSAAVTLFGGIQTSVSAGVLLRISSLPLISLSDLMIRMNRILSAGGLFTREVVSPPLWVILLFYLGSFFAVSESGFLLVSRKRWRVLAGGIAALLLFTGWTAAWSASPFDHTDIIMVDVGQGDCLAVRSRGRCVLFDGGGKQGYDVGRKVLRPFLLKNGEAKVDLACATHLHTDHYLGLKQLQECYPVRRMMIRGKAGDRIRISEDAWAEVLWPERQEPSSEDENRNSLIFKVHVKGVTVLVTGDVGFPGEEEMMAKYRGTDRLRCDILKAGHHGSRFSTSDAFLDAVHPRLVLIGVGKNNGYGHPSPETLKRLDRHHIPYFRTDRDGAVGIKTGPAGSIRVFVNRREGA